MGIRVAINHADRLPVSDELIEQAVRAVLVAEQVTEGDLAVTFLEDAAIRDLNRGYLDHDWPTDVISFALEPDPGAPADLISGELYVGVDRARAQAAERHIPAIEEAVRLAVHGTLHVVGHDHPEEQRESSAFFARQEELVSKILTEWDR